jgi:hypothetical protein
MLQTHAKHDASVIKRGQRREFLFLRRQLGSQNWAMRGPSSRNSRDPDQYGLTHHNGMGGDSLTSYRFRRCLEKIKNRRFISAAVCFLCGLFRRSGKHEAISVSSQGSPWTCTP